MMNDPERLVLVGRVAGAFGVRGEVRIRAYTDSPLALLNYRELRRANGTPAITLVSGRSWKESLIARVKDVGTKTEADALKGLDLYALRAALPPVEAEDEFYLADLIGLRAEAPDGTPLGVIKAVQNFGAGDLLEVEPVKGASWLVVFSQESAPEIDIAAGRIVVVRPPEID